MPNKIVSLRNERGAIPVIAIVVGVIVLAAVGGYLFLTKSEKGAALVAQNAPGVASTILNDKCEYNDPDLCKFLNNWAGMNKFRAKSSITEGGQKMESLFEMDGDKKTHMQMSQGGKESYNTISIDDSTYTKDYSDNKWWKQTLEKVDEKTLKEYKADFDTPDPSAGPNTTKFNKLGKEACGSLQCFKYEVVEESMPDDKQLLWFDDKEYKLRKLRIETKEGATEMEYSYDGISIQVPSPVKEGKAGEMMPLGTMPQLSPEEKQQYEDALKQSKQMKQDLPSSDNSYVPDDNNSYSEEEY